MVVFFIKRLFIAVLIPFFALLTIQICLKNPKTREMFTSIEEYENINFSSEAEKSFSILLKKNSIEAAEIYFNGDKLVDFNEKIICIDVPCDGVYEIKNNSNRPLSVTVSSKNPDLITEVFNSEFNFGIRPLCRVNID